MFYSSIVTNAPLYQKGGIILFRGKVYTNQGGSSVKSFFMNFLRNTAAPFLKNVVAPNLLKSAAHFSDDLLEGKAAKQAALDRLKELGMNVGKTIMKGRGRVKSRGRKRKRRNRARGKKKNMKGSGRKKLYKTRRASKRSKRVNRKPTFKRLF
jgi:hypothetical protein